MSTAKKQTTTAEATEPSLTNVYSFPADVPQAPPTVQVPFDVPVAVTPSVAQLAEAMAAAQAEIRVAVKASTNPHFRSSYADLTSIWEVCQEVLPKNGLAVFQFPSYANGLVTVTTMIAHRSGEYVVSALSLPVSKQDAQGVGSATTYGRRYGLAAAIGVVADVDDDGNAAVGRPSEPAAAAPTRKTNSSRSKAASAPSNSVTTDAVFLGVRSDVSTKTNEPYTYYAFAVASMATPLRHLTGSGSPAVEGRLDKLFSRLANSDAAPDINDDDGTFELGESAVPLRLTLDTSAKYPKITAVELDEVEG